MVALYRFHFSDLKTQRPEKLTTEQISVGDDDADDDVIIAEIHLPPGRFVVSGRRRRCRTAAPTGTGIVIAVHGSGCRVEECPRTLCGGLLQGYVTCGGCMTVTS